MTVFTQVFIGSVLGMASGIALLLNLSVLFVLYRGGFLRSAQNPIFILTFLNVLGDSMQCAWILIYLTPTSISQSFIFPYKEKGAVALLFAYLFQLQWYQCVLTQMLMSVNRLVVVVLPNFQRIFSRRNVIIITLMVFPTSAVLSVIADIILPCCTTYYYWGTFSYKFFGEGTNYKNLFMDIPLNATTSSLSLICYGAVFVFVYKSNRGVHLQSNPNIATRRKQNEIRYALQFGLISLFFLAAWVTFRILPLLVPPTMPEWFALTAFCVIAHCSANSFIYLTMNKEIKRIIGGKSQVQSVTPVARIRQTSTDLVLHSSTAKAYNYSAWVVFDTTADHAGWGPLCKDFTKEEHDEYGECWAPWNYTKLPYFCDVTSLIPAHLRVNRRDGTSGIDDALMFGQLKDNGLLCNATHGSVCGKNQDVTETGTRIGAVLNWSGFGSAKKAGPTIPSRGMWFGDPESDPDNNEVEAVLLGTLASGEYPWGPIEHMDQRELKE